MRATRGLYLAAAVLAAVLAALSLAGCAPTVALEPATHATDAKCATVIATLSADVDTVSSLSPRVTNAQGTAAWGTPTSILLRCGIPVPDPTSTLVCITVDGVDWLRQPDKNEVFVFTTYGRSPAVAVTVDSKNVHADGNQALTDVGPAVATIRAQHHCLSPVEILQNGSPVNPTPSPTPSPTPER